MPGGLTCNACNKEFADDAEQKLHYKSEWHRYNLKRKVAGVPGVTEALFQARQLALAEEKSRLNSTPMSYGCALCGKEYRSSKAHAQHLKSKNHIIKASQGLSSTGSEQAVIKPLTNRASSRHAPAANPSVSREVEGEESEESEESEDDWVEVDSNDDLGEASESLKDLNVNQNVDEDDKMDEDLDTSSCFICDLKHETIESCMVHMHKQHGFFIPDVEYLKDPKGFLTYVGLKVIRDFMCLYCNDRCHPFQSLEAVRKHMIAKGHCKVRYGDGGDDEEVELEEFYDYSSSYMDAEGKQLVISNDGTHDVELSGSELIITRKTENGISVKTFGSREFLRYYRQKPRPSAPKDMALAVSLASRYRSMGLATVQSREQIVRIKVMRALSRSGVEAMRTKIGMKNNVIRNLPKNVPY